MLLMDYIFGYDSTKFIQIEWLNRFIQLYFTEVYL